MLEEYVDAVKKVLAIVRDLLAIIIMLLVLFFGTKIMLALDDAAKAFTGGS